MAVDLTKLVFHSGYPAFINTRIYTGTLTISGTTSPGLNIKTFTVTLDQAPDYLDVVFNGPTDAVYGSDPRPDGGWFKQGAVWVRTDNAAGADPNPWYITYSISGVTLTITASYVHQISLGETLTSTNFYYRAVDYRDTLD